MGKRAGGERRNKGGCSWSLMGLLGFCGGPGLHRFASQAPGNQYSSFRECLLSNCHDGNDGPLDYEGDDGSQTSKSIRMLIDEEISQEEKLAWMSCTDSEQEDSEHLDTASSSTVYDGPDCDKGVACQQSGRFQPKDPAETPAENLNQAAMLHEIIDNIHEHQKIQTMSENSIKTLMPTEVESVALSHIEVRRDQNLQQAVNEVLEVFLHDKILSIEGMGYEVEPRKLPSGLERSNSDGDLALRLIQGINSNHAQYTQDLQNAPTEKLLTPESCRLLEDINMLGSESSGLKTMEENGNGRKPFVEEEDGHFSSRAESSFTASTSNCPSQSACSLPAYKKKERAFFLYLLREIKGMVRNLLGSLGSREKKQNFIQKGVLRTNSHGFPLKYEHERMPNNRIDAHMDTSISHYTKQVINAERVDTVGSPNEHTDMIELNFQKEAKRHLAEILNCKAKANPLQERKEVHTLQKWFAMQKHDPSFGHSPDREEDPASPPMQMKLTFTDQQYDLHHCNLLEDGEEDLPCNNSDSEEQQQSLDACKNCQDDIDMRGLENLSAVDIECSSNESIDIIDTPEDDSHQRSAQDSATINFDLQIPWSYTPGALTISKTDSPDILIEKPDRPSPVSVLKQTFLDDIRIKECTTSEESDHEKPPIELQFEEHVHELEERSKLSYLRSLLEASGFLQSEAWSSRRRRRLDGALFREIQPPSGGTEIDHSLYFDRISEALHGIHARYFHVKPWVGFADPKIRPPPRGEDLVQELWRKAGSCGASGNLRTLDEIIGDDLRAEGRWAEIGEGVDEFGVVVGDEIMEEMVEEVVGEIMGFFVD